MGDHSIPKGQTRIRPSSAWWRCEQMGHEGGPAQPSEGGGYLTALFLFEAKSSNDNINGGVYPVCLML